ncbi:MAG: hypothetical protein ACTSX9_03105 [Candidatus Njordarchaeales archaeon]
MSIGRFQVMAVLQAARAYVLGMPLYLAKSWGLNRAIFYAAAKKGFKKKRIPTRYVAAPEELKKKPIERLKNMWFLGDEGAYITKKNGKIYFTIGGQAQTEEDFRKQIEERFEPIFDKIWEEAIKIVKEFDVSILLSQRQFYEKVYKPLRDLLAEKWSKMVQMSRMKKLDNTG